MLSLYQRIGGAPAVNAAVELFYAKVLSDNLLIPFFANMDMRQIKAHQRMFLTYAFGGFVTYTGRPLDDGGLPFRCRTKPPWSYPDGIECSS